MKIFKINFGSLLTYTPNGTDFEHQKSRKVMISLKNDTPTESGILMSDKIAKIIKEKLETYPFSDYFNKDTILIPTPKSSLQHGYWHRETMIFGYLNVMTSSTKTIFFGLNDNFLTFIES